MTDVHVISDFSFYLGFTKELILSLPDPKDRSIATLWLEKLQEINEKNEQDIIHVEYLKLLIMAMHGNNFSHFFGKPPPEGDLEPISIKEIISTTNNKTTTKSKKPYPFVYTSVSSDFCDFVAIQEIKNYGLQGYYAVSLEPLLNWIHSKIPKKNSKENKNDRNFEPGKQKFLSTSTEGLIQNSEIETVKNPENESKTSMEVKKDEAKTQRREVTEIEVKPCWGTNRYIERFIDESSHFSSDLELLQADAFLYNFKERKMKKIKKAENIAKENPCLLSSKRRYVERMMDLPRCAMDPNEEDIDPVTHYESERINFTCQPKEQDEINIDCFDPCVTDDDESHNYFLNLQEPEYRKIPMRSNKLRRMQIKNKVPSYINYYCDNSSGQKSVRISEKNKEEKYLPYQDERGHQEGVSEVNFLSNYLPKASNRPYESHYSVESRIPKNTIALDSSNKTRTKVSLPVQSNNIYSRDKTERNFLPHSNRSVENTIRRFDSNSDSLAENDEHARRETMRNDDQISSHPIQNELNLEYQDMGSYGPVSGLTTNLELLNGQDEDFQMRSRSFVTLQSDNEFGNENNSFEDLFSNSDRSNSNTAQKRYSKSRKNFED